MKRSILSFSFLVILTGVFTLSLVSFSSGPPAGRSGAPGDLTCQNGCHNSFPLNSGAGTPSIVSNIPGAGYEPGQTYTLTFAIEQTGISKFGFQGMAYNETLDGSIGSLIVTDANNTQIATSGAREYIEHTATGTTVSTWECDWTAPDAGSGDVVVHAAFNAANGANGNQGDLIYTANLPITENVATSLSNIEIARILNIQKVGDAYRVSYQMPRSGEAHLTLTDLQGRTAWESHAYNNGTLYETEISALEVRNGIYVLRAHSAGKTLSRKIVLR